MESFHFCPRCGSPRFLPLDARAKRCEDCGFVYYHNAAAATVGVLFSSCGELLACRRARNPMRGTLDLPGGFAEPGETLEEGCCRELREETGLKTRVTRFLFSLPNVYEFSGFHVDTADSFFLLHTDGKQMPQAGDDAGELLWLPREKIRPERFGLESIRHGVEVLLEKFPELWRGETP